MTVTGGYVVAIHIFNTQSLLNIAKKMSLYLLMPRVHIIPVRNHILKSESLDIVLIKQEEFWLVFTSTLVKPSSIPFCYTGKERFLPSISCQFEQYLLE